MSLLLIICPICGTPGPPDDRATEDDDRVDDNDGDDYDADAAAADDDTGVT